MKLTYTREVDETDRKIIEDIRRGLVYKEIALRVHLSVPAVKYRVAVMKSHYKCNSLFELIEAVRND